MQLEVPVKGRAMDELKGLKVAILVDDGFEPSRWLLGSRTARGGRDQDPARPAEWLTQVEGAPILSSTTLLARSGFFGTPAFPATAVQTNLNAVVRIAELFQEVLEGGTLRGDDRQVDQANHAA